MKLRDSLPRCWPTWFCCGVLLAGAVRSPHVAAQPLVVAGSPGFTEPTGARGYGFGAPPVGPVSVNDGGTAVVSSEISTPSANVLRAVRWDGSGISPTVLGNVGTDVLGQSSSHAYAVNAFGTAVGMADKYDGGTHWGARAVRWDASGTTATELEVLGSAPFGSSSAAGAYAVNNSGTAVGFSNVYLGGVSFVGTRAVRWDGSGTAATELGNLGTDNNIGMTDAEAIAVNDPGTAVGFCQRFDAGIDKGLRAVRWNASSTVAVELGNLGINAVGRTQAGAVDVNDAGTSIGFADKYGAGGFVGVRAVRWDASGTAATELGNLGTDPNGRISGGNHTP